MDNILSPEEMKQGLIDAHLDPWNKNHINGFKAGAQAVLAKLQVSDEELEAKMAKEIFISYLAWTNGLDYKTAEYHWNTLAFEMEKDKAYDAVKVISPIIALGKASARQEGVKEERERLIKLLHVNTCNENSAEDCERMKRDGTCEKCWREILTPKESETKC